MNHDYERTITRDGVTELEVRKSRFICTLTRVMSDMEARSAIETTRKRYWDANHNCTAWRIGTDGRSQRSSDDGEPSGTAGVPMLEVLNHRDLIDVVAVVTRYFGGVKLGAGGLIRAYGAAVSGALDEVGIVERRPLHILEVAIAHGDAGRVEHALRNSRYPLADVTYNAGDVGYTVHLEPEQLDSFRAFVAEITMGQAVAREAGIQFVEIAVESGDA